MHNVDGAVGFCDNIFNILIVQVPLHGVANTGESPATAQPTPTPTAAWVADEKE
ncbi:hypothetical protein GCM10017567_35080 [Amycolatopsis bullii]|uniref:Uncharacterized protein n=1 Tax=Amycolatopsis bullii TaxID=941987 RepID=A0ABQ3KDZ3_9PSEU|nr:hypothetical protein GCM10017567_35080 [Amycolatopsis bullii]